MTDKKQNAPSVRNRKIKKAMLITGMILLILALLLGSAAWMIHHYLDKINRVDNSTISVVPPGEEDFETDDPTDIVPPQGETSNMDPGDIEWGDIEAIKDDDLINIMLVGQDRREGEGRQRSDTMILCSINPKTKQISLISFLRDLYVRIPGGYSDNRLNVAYKFGGFPLLEKTLRVNFGITVDANVEVDFEGFIQVIDVLGGVDVEVTAAEAKFLGEGYVEGINHMTGEQALHYARIRKLDNDFKRTGRQRKILESVFREMKGLGVTELFDVMDSVLPALTTDMTNGEILSLAGKLFPIMKSMELYSYRVPADNAYYNASIRGMAVLVPDLPLIRRQLKEEYLPLGD